jgi:fido (protein-threonine AMPylation protein)
MEDLNEKLKNVYLDKDRQIFLDEKIDAIADLFQLLEWLHPFFDGQGRTDLVLMAKLLSEQGFNPTILDQPYTSTWSSFPKWKEYLRQGMEHWRQEKTMT